MSASRESFDLLRLLERTVALHSGKVALADREGRELTYGELGRNTRAIALALVQGGVRRGERIAILGPSGPAWGQVFFGALESGAVVVPLDAQLGPEELRRILLDCAPRRVFASEELREKLDAALAGVEGVQEVHSFGWPAGAANAGDRSRLPRERGREEVALLAYTSGTSGAPKGVMVTFENLLFQAERLTELMATGPDDGFVSILPQNHLLELTGGFLGPLFAGARIDYSSPLAPQDVVERMRERRATVLLGVPLFFHALARLLRALAARGLAPAQALGGGMRMLISGGAALHPEVLRFFADSGIPLLEGYGLTETSPVVALNRIGAQRPGSVGRPLPGVELRIAEPDEEGTGEVLTRGPHVMKGYWSAPGLTAEALDADGWFHTGDLGRIDADGHLWITGRKKELIVLGSGKKVQPAEVESALGNARELAEACVVGDLRRGRTLAGTERVCAIVVPAPELAARFAAAAELRAAVERGVESAAGVLAEYKRPRRVLLHPGPLPRTPTGKLRRAELRDWAASVEDER